VADLLPATAVGAAGCAGAAAMMVKMFCTFETVSTTVLTIAAEAFDDATKPVVIARATSIAERINLRTRLTPNLPVSIKD
jgi:1-aminocyclopropane-1-carboxylate deaminase/D-cysteine desulfhydrase-like pyridoxal-dependent ACC family enzyme